MQGLALALAGFNLRMAMAAPGPVLDSIKADLGASDFVVGSLTSLPFICMGVFALLVPFIDFGRSSIKAGSIGLLLVFVGTAMRGLVGSVALLLVGTVLMGLGVGVLGVALPQVVKAWFPTRAGAATGLYTGTLAIGVALIGVGIVPLSEALGGWQKAFLVSSAPALLAAVVWFVLLPTERQVDGVAEDRESASRAQAVPSGGRARLRVAFPGRAAVWLTLSFGLTATCFSAMIAWVAAAYGEAGWSESQAALATASIGALTIPAALIVPSLLDGFDRRPAIAVSVTMMAIGVLGVALSPLFLPWMWLLLFGLGNGASFALQLALPVDLGANQQQVRDLTAWMLGIGFLMAAAAPALVGLLHELQGDFILALSLVGLAGIFAAAATMRIPRAPHRS